MIGDVQRDGPRPRRRPRPRPGRLWPRVPSSADGVVAPARAATAHARWRRRALLSTLVLLCLLPRWTTAAFVQFENCLDRAIVNSDPVRLQFRPLNVSATFNATSKSHNLNLTVYGNVTGSATTTPPPPPDDPAWTNPNVSLGKIVDLSEANNKYSTLLARFNVLSYTPYQPGPTRFCDSVVQQTCPLTPDFSPDAYVSRRLRPTALPTALPPFFSLSLLSSPLR